MNALMLHRDTPLCSGFLAEHLKLPHANKIPLFPELYCLFDMSVLSKIMYNWLSLHRAEEGHALSYNTDSLGYLYTVDVT